VPFRVRQDPAANDACGSIFDRQANRRTHLIMTLPSAEIKGWAVTGKAEVASISLVSPRRGVIGGSHPKGIRPDVDATKHASFSLRAAIATPEEWDAVLVRAKDSNGRIYETSARSLGENQVHVVSGEDDQLILGVDSLSAPLFENPWTWKAQAAVEAFYLPVSRWAAWVLVIAPLAGLLVFVPGRAHFSVIVLLITAAVFTRLTFFTMLDSTSWNGYQPRYLYPIFPLLSVLIVLLWAHLLGFICSAVRSRFASRPD
jgi:hypothetical protein